jgi:hypothetical protein
MTNRLAVDVECAGRLILVKGPEVDTIAKDFIRSQGHDCEFQSDGDSLCMTFPSRYRRDTIARIAQALIAALTRVGYRLLTTMEMYLDMGSELIYNETRTCLLPH